MTFYVAPRFHKIEEINEYWSSNQMASKSIFVRPGDIGHLDDAAHHVAFDKHRAYLCSEPKEILHFDGRGVLEQLQGAIDADQRPLREKLPEIMRQVREAERTGRANAEARRREIARARLSADGDSVLFVTEESDVGAIGSTPAPERPIPRRATRRLSEVEQQLRDAADLAARALSTQMLIVQPAD